MAKKKSQTKAKSQRRVQDAFQMAERETRGWDNNDSDSDDNVRGGIMRAKKSMEGGHSGSEDDFEDEELDSDEAFGSEDDYDILDSKFKGGKLNDEEYDSDGSYTSIDEDDLIPLSEVWDRDDADMKSTVPSSSSKQSNDIVLNEDFESESEEESSDDEPSEDDGNEDEEDPFTGFSEDEEIELSNVKSAIDAKRPKALKKKRFLVNETQTESEFNVPVNGTLSLEDMIAGVEGAQEELRFVDTTEDQEGGAKVVAVPLPQSIKERNDRRAAYEITKDEVNKWKDTIQENRKAEVLKFPLNPEVEHNMPSSFTAPEKPLTELEEKVQKVLVESSMDNMKKEEALFEEIMSAKMSKEEMMKRTNELRLMRELMYRGQRDSKRLKKIKSKAYRQKLRKEKLKNQELIDELEGDDGDDEEADLQRARERMSLKHKNQSAWAKSMTKSGMTKDKEARDEVESMLRQGERLRMKQLGRDGEDEDQRDLDDMERELEEENVEVDLSKLGKGVMNMDFMKNAAARSRQDNQRLLEKLRNGDDYEEDQNVDSVNVSHNVGRRVYTPGVSDLKAQTAELDIQVANQIAEENEKSLSGRLNERRKLSEKVVVSTEQAVKATASNPWLSSDSKSRKSNRISVVDESSSVLAKSASKINKKRSAGSNHDLDDSNLIDLDSTLRVVDPYGGEDEGEEHEIESGGMFKQKDLIRQAFAGDDVVKEFEEEKKQVIEEEDDQEVDDSMPGWGGWAGEDIKPKQSKKRKIVKGVMSANKRKDKNMKKVIINEKVNKKNSKFQAQGVPYPFETMEQYERSLRLPMGQEWTSRETHQKLTMPRVIAKHGSIIDPLKAPFK
ncbi:unnamed protein product [Kuraishia capsulata CBS 1993]|uniref:U3 small nucleolar RNA-associated protein 14 n=1 Tax=Kuraishia capsulata CBS 1993 TaxID=1382522 RepID=W6MTC6_9ASCO|nr:uncharacterized protein KUCA_T00005984001 [Kuraishia capsulata CBS 1993]CDK29989.1 unnamed protein product [Kuraishia capsulata CBS 1993]